MPRHFHDDHSNIETYFDVLILNMDFRAGVSLDTRTIKADKWLLLLLLEKTQQSDTFLFQSQLDLV